MNVTINLSSDEERKLRERASASGEDLAGYIHRIIDRHIQAPDELASLLAPLRQQFAESGMSEEELDSLVEEVRRHDEPVARLVPAVATKHRPDTKQVIEELKAFSKGNTLGEGLTIRELIEEGRRF